MALPILQKDPQNSEIFKLTPKKTIKFFLELVRKIEGKIIESLDFELSRVLAFDFLSLFSCDLWDVQQRKKVVDFSHFLLLLVTLNSDYSSVNRCLAAFSVLYLSNRLFGNSKKWPKLKNSRYIFGKSSIKKQEGINATLHIFSLVRSTQKKSKQPKRKTLSRKKSFTDMLLDKINKLFKDEKKEENVFEFEGSSKGRIFDHTRIQRFYKDQFVCFSPVDEMNYTLELSFPLKNVKQSSIHIFSGEFNKNLKNFPIQEKHSNSIHIL